MKKPIFFVIGLLCAILLPANLAAQSEKESVRYSPGDGITIDALDLTVKPQTTFVLQGTPDPNFGDGSGKFNASSISYIDITKKFGDAALVYLDLRIGWGQTVQKDLNLFSNVNFNAYDIGGNIHARIYYYEQYILDKQITILAGRHNPREVLDQVKYSNDDDTQFLSYLFNRSPAIDWPSDFTFTIHANVSPKAAEFLQFECNYMEGDADWQKVFEGGIYTFQLNFKPAKLFDLEVSKWDGNYRFYSWLNTQDHTKLSEEGNGPSTTTGEFNYGFGIGLDQMLGEVFGVFCRLGWQRPEILPANNNTPVYIAWSGGAQMTGKYWQRENDVLALAVGQLFPSKQWINAASDHYGAGEGHIETYYNFAITSYMRVGPDLQIIWDPHGVSKSYEGSTDPIFVYGARLNVVF